MYRMLLVNQLNPLEKKLCNLCYVSLLIRCLVFVLFLTTSKVKLLTYENLLTNLLNVRA